MAQTILAQRLAQQGVKEVPERFIKPIAERPASQLSSPNHSRGSVPVIDLAGLQGGSRQHTMAQIDEACQDWGFFQVVNHGIPSSLLQLVKDVGRDFFELPFEEKQKCAMKPGEILGYGRHYQQAENAVLDWVDCLLHYVSPTSLRDEENTWPAKPPNYREVMDAYAKELQKLISLLLALFSENLGLPSTYLEEAFGEFSLAFRVNYYPPCPQPNLVMGISPHSDSGCITFLIQDEIDGLQVRKNGNWVTVEPLADGLVVNVADMLQVITNGRYVSVEHRALVNNVKERMSIVGFYLPSTEALISPAATLTDKTHPALYRATKYGDYLSTYMKKPLAGKAHVESLSLQDKVDTNT
ncbi:hypothetical protein O6H91_05G055700 [Diphasiastrum complanatum]|uniref:Uncharacterized protein n=1 Tax=Diphasiastrum complanatum TaxID=34168 RepID=A0ACC2DNL9_DIPCM|nr:hypothetical protein O6H91_05G055700 [Diphasiastrum complanatum]